MIICGFVSSTCTKFFSNNLLQNWRFVCSLWSIPAPYHGDLSSKIGVSAEEDENTSDQGEEEAEEIIAVRVTAFCKLQGKET